MSEPRTLLCILAHPDDESLGMGPTLAKCAAEGVETHLLTATRGERGWKGAPEAYPGRDALGELREGELRAAAAALGVGGLQFLGLMDGEVDRAEPRAVVTEIAAHLRRVRPQVVVTFGPDGAYGHPDHIAVSQFAAAALVRAADPSEPLGDLAPHAVAKFYYLAGTKREMAAYQRVFGDLKKRVGEVERRFEGWDDWAVTTRIDTREHVAAAWRAIACHRSQLRDYRGLMELAEEERRAIFGEQTYYRVASLVNGGREVEDDLFAGLTTDAPPET